MDINKVNSDRQIQFIYDLVCMKAQEALFGEAKSSSLANDIEAFCTNSRLQNVQSMVLKVMIFLLIKEIRVLLGNDVYRTAMMEVLLELEKESINSSSKKVV